MFLTELGVIITDKSMDKIIGKKFPKGENILKFRQIESGEVDDWLISIISEANTKDFEELLVREELLKKTLLEKGYNVNTLSEGEYDRMQNKKLSLMIDIGWVKDDEEAKDLIRLFALEISKIKLKELAAKPDLQVMQSVQSLDEIDKVVNIIEARVKEWYGLHFPELDRILDSPESYVKFVNIFGNRENITKKKLEKHDFNSIKINLILSAAERTQGTELRDIDLKKILILAQEATQLSVVRDGLAKHVEKTMEQFAPNITSVAGATIGARLIVKARGMDKLARLPASTIQVLGAEKALFRALRTGAKPPKHGILFQHQSIHPAPKWQRGKIARALAGKIAIASRIDVFRGTKEEGLKEIFDKRLEEIKSKYKEPPIPVKNEFVKHGKKSGKERRKSQKNSARKRR